jgi:hypothetical protein
VTAPWIAAFVCLWVLVIGLALTLIGVLRKVATALDGLPEGVSTRQLPAGPPVGRPLPPLPVQRADGSAARLADLPGPFVLAVLTSHCSPCLSIAGRLRDEPDTVARLDGMVVVTDPEGPQRLALGPSVTVLVDAHNEVIPALELPGTPFAVAVGADGNVRAAQILAGPSQLVSLFDSIRPAPVEASNY